MNPRRLLHLYTLREQEGRGLRVDHIHLIITSGRTTTSQTIVATAYLRPVPETGGNSFLLFRVGAGFDFSRLHGRLKGRPCRRIASVTQ